MDISDATAPNEPSSTSVATTSHRAYLLGEQHSVSGIQELREMLHSVAPNVRRLAASALYKLADLDFDKQPVVKDLVVIGCSDAHPQVRQYALKALKRYVAFIAQYEGCIARVAQDHEQKDYVRQAAQNLYDLISTSRSDAVVSSSRCNITSPETASEPAYKEVISHPSQNVKEEQLITQTSKAMSPIQVKDGAGSGKTTTGAIALYERGRFAEFMQFSERIEDADVICLRAFLKNDGMGCVKDMTDAETLINGIINEIKVRAENGNLVSQTNLAQLYRDGLGVKCDYAASAKWYCIAAVQGYARAQTGLGLMCANGHGVDKDEVLAVKLYCKAIKQGYAEAQTNLGLMFEHGRGVEQDDIQAVEWYNKAAEQGQASGQYNLGRMYASGRGVKKDDVLAVAWYRKAAEQGHAMAQYNLGWMYANGRGVEKDDDQAVAWYRKAASQGILKAMENLASILDMRKEKCEVTRLDGKCEGKKNKVGGLGMVGMTKPSLSTREATITNNEELQIHHFEDVLWARQVVPLGHIPPHGWSVKAKNVKARLLPQRYLVRRKGITNHQDRKDFPYDFVATLAAVAINGLSEIHNVTFLPFQWNEIARQACSRDRIYIRAEWLEVPLESGWVSRSKGREYFRGRLIYPTLLEVVKSRTDRGEALPTAEKLLALRLEDEDLQGGLGVPLTTSK